MNFSKHVESQNLSVLIEGKSLYALNILKLKMKMMTKNYPLKT